MTQGAHSTDQANQAKGVAKTLEKQRYRGVADCVVKMVAEEGWGSLLKGIGPRVTWIGIGGGIFFFALEAAQSVLVPGGGGAKSAA